MASNRRLQYSLGLLLPLSLIFSLSRADVGTAGFYNPPYLPSACYGNEGSNFPADALFAAAGERVWDDGAACGRVYWVRCLSAAGVKDACIRGRSIPVKIVDRASANSKAALLLSAPAFRMIANPAAAEINAEYSQ